MRQSADLNAPLAREDGECLCWALEDGARVFDCCREFALSITHELCALGHFIITAPNPLVTGVHNVSLWPDSAWLMDAAAEQNIPDTGNSASMTAFVNFAQQIYRVATIIRQSSAPSPNREQAASPLPPSVPSPCLITSKFPKPLNPQSLPIYSALNRHQHHQCTQESQRRPIFIYASRGRSTCFLLDFITSKSLRIQYIRNSCINLPPLRLRNGGRTHQSFPIQ